MVSKFIAFDLTQSQSILSDALESIVNVVAASLALFVIYYSIKPADQDHPYGHGKVEYFSAAFEGGLISFAALIIVIEAVRHLINPEPLKSLDYGIAIVAVAGIANLFLGLYLVRVGKSAKSQALKASGYHVISDFWTSAVVIFGLLVVHLTNWFWLDSVLAIGVGLLLGFSGYRLIRESISGLMDEEDLEILEELADAFSESVEPGIIQLHHVKVIRSGWYHHIDSHMVMPEFWTVQQTHEAINKFEQSVIASYPFAGEMNFHVDPCRQAYCEVCDLENCKVRKQEFVKRHPIRLTDLRSREEPTQFQ